MKQCKLIIVHGINGSSQSNFFPCLSTIFDLFNLDYDISDYEGGDLNMSPIASNWLNKLDSIVTSTTKPIVLVGYSLGARAVLMYLEKHDVTVDTLILISAPPNSTLLGKFARHGRIATFFSKKLNVSKITNKAVKIIQVHATNDKAVPYFMGRMLSKELHSDFITFTHEGHFSNPSNIKQIAPIILRELH